MLLSSGDPSKNDSICRGSTLSACQTQNFLMALLLHLENKFLGSLQEIPKERVFNTQHPVVSHSEHITHKRPFVMDHCKTFLKLFWKNMYMFFSLMSHNLVRTWSLSFFFDIREIYHLWGREILVWGGTLLSTHTSIHILMFLWSLHSTTWIRSLKIWDFSGVLHVWNFYFLDDNMRQQLWCFSGRRSINHLASNLLTSILYSLFG